ncbi:MAG TPA: hypothetical protein VLL50_12110, partial [Usitatibacter sp.]|nr:hypothetical protein [Usitatibacter sp.]
SGINNAVPETAALLAVAIFGLAMAHAFHARLEPRLEEAKVPAAVRDEIVKQEAKLAAIELPRASDPVQASAKEAIGESFIAGFRVAELIAAVLALLSALCAWISLGVISGHPRRR